MTLCHNYYTTPLQQHFLRSLAAMILNQDYVQMQNQHKEDTLKKEIMFDYTFNDEEVILWLNDIFQQYSYPDIDSCAELYKFHRTCRNN